MGGGGEGAGALTSWGPGTSVVSIRGNNRVLSKRRRILDEDINTPFKSCQRNDADGAAAVAVVATVMTEVKETNEMLI